jgi:GntR family transcriptional regulator, transcriptional repressor for pyruvate dehydrogenase complex
MTVPKFSLDKRETLVEEIVRKLLDYLLSHHVPPGGRLPSERQLAEAFGVGRSVIREALKSLSLLGVVHVRQGDGTYLTDLQSSLLPKVIEWGLLLGERRTLDLVEARRHIEVATARLAAERRDERQLSELAALLERMRHAAEDAEEFVDADIAFHIKIAEASRNTALLDILSGIQALLRVWITRVISAAGRTEPSYREHEPVYDAILRQDPDAAAAAMDRHLLAASERLLSSISVDPAEHGTQRPSQ